MKGTIFSKCFTNISLLFGRLSNPLSPKKRNGHTVPHFKRYCQHRPLQPLAFWNVVVVPVFWMECFTSIEGWTNFVGGFHNIYQNSGPFLTNFSGCSRCALHDQLYWILVAWWHGWRKYAAETIQNIGHIRPFYLLTSHFTHWIAVRRFQRQTMTCLCPFYDGSTNRPFPAIRYGCFKDSSITTTAPVHLLKCRSYNWTSSVGPGMVLFVSEDFFCCYERGMIEDSLISHINISHWDLKQYTRRTRQVQCLGIFTEQETSEEKMQCQGHYI